MRSPSTSTRPKNETSFCAGSGFTLIEIIVVVGIIAVLSSIGLFLSMDFYRSYAFRSEKDILLSSLQKARTQALGNVNQARHGVRVESDRYIIFQGDDYASRTTALDEIIQASPGITLSGSPGLPLEIVFDRLTGNEYDPSGSINESVTLTQNFRNATVSINSNGQIDW